MFNKFCILTAAFEAVQEWQRWSEDLSDIKFMTLWLTAVRIEIFSLTHINASSAALTFITTFLWSLIIDKQNIWSDHAGERETDC